MWTMRQCESHLKPDIEILVTASQRWSLHPRTHGPWRSCHLCGLMESMEQLTGQIAGNMLTSIQQSLVNLWQEIQPCLYCPIKDWPGICIEYSGVVLLTRYSQSVVTIMLLYHGPGDIDVDSDRLERRWLTFANSSGYWHVPLEDKGSRLSAETDKMNALNSICPPHHHHHHHHHRSSSWDGTTTTTLSPWSPPCILVN